jgi:hypothetical protein
MRFEVVMQPDDGGPQPDRQSRLAERLTVTQTSGRGRTATSYSAAKVVGKAVFPRRALIGEWVQRVRYQEELKDSGERLYVRRDLDVVDRVAGRDVAQETDATRRSPRLMMDRPATGQVIGLRRERGTMFALRFRTLGNHLLPFHAVVVVPRQRRRRSPPMTVTPMSHVWARVALFQLAEPSFASRSPNVKGIHR